MKKYVIVLLICLFVVCALVACGETESVDINENGGSEPPKEVAEDRLTLRADNVFSPVNEFVNANEPYELVDCYVDGKDTYYCLNLGRLKNVSVDAVKKSISHEKSPADVKRTYTTSQVTVKSIKNELSRIIQRLEYDLPRSYVGENQVQAFSLFDERIAAGGVRYYSSLDSDGVETDSESLTLLFTASCLSGKYRVSNVLDCDVYLYISKNAESGAYAIRVKVFAIQNITERFEYVEGDFTDVNLTDVVFDRAEISRLPSPVKLLDGSVLPRPENLEAETYYVDTQALSCKLHNKYNYTQKDPDCNNPHYSHDFEMGKFIVGGAAIKDYNKGEFYIADESVGIKFRLNYDPANLPLQDTMTARSVNAEGKISGFYNLPFDVGEREVGKGMLVALVTYEDGSPEKKICIPDVFNGKKSGDEIEICLDISKPCTVDIAICYEFVMWAPGLLGIVDDYWRDWRINQTFYIS